MREIFLQRTFAGGGEAVFSPRHAPGERFLDDDVLRVFEFPGVHAQIAVGRLEQPFQIVERQPLVDREGADDAETQPLVDEPIEAPDRRLLSAARRLVAPKRASATADCRLRATADCRLLTGDCRLLYPPYLLAITRPNTMWRPPNPTAMNELPQAAGATKAATPSAMKASPITGTTRTDSAPPATSAVP